jgi:hypothetical protein
MGRANNTGVFGGPWWLANHHLLHARLTGDLGGEGGHATGFSQERKEACGRQGNLVRGYIGRSGHIEHTYSGRGV